MLGVEGIRRAQPKLALAGQQVAVGRPSVHYPASSNAAFEPPARAPAGATLQVPATVSKCVRHCWGPLQQAADEGACTHVQPRTLTQASRNDALRKVLAIRSVFGVFGYIIEQDEFYRRMFHADKPAAGHTSHVACYHARNGGSPG